jgi:hypothetical protein
MRVGIELDPDLLVAHVAQLLNERGLEVGLEPQPDVAVRGTETQDRAVP